MQSSYVGNCYAGNTFGKAIAGILAHSKGRSIGIYEDKEKDEGAEKEKAKEEEEKGVKKVDVFGMKVCLLLPDEVPSVWWEHSG